MCALPISSWIGLSSVAAGVGVSMYSLLDPVLPISVASGIAGACSVVGVIVPLLICVGQLDLDLADRRPCARRSSDAASAPGRQRPHARQLRHRVVEHALARLQQLGHVADVAGAAARHDARRTGSGEELQRAQRRQQRGVLGDLSAGAAGRRRHRSRRVAVRQALRRRLERVDARVADGVGVAGALRLQPRDQLEEDLIPRRTAGDRVVGLAAIRPRPRRARAGRRLRRARFVPAAEAVVAASC